MAYLNTSIYRFDEFVRDAQGHLLPEFAAHYINLAVELEELNAGLSSGEYSFMASDEESHDHRSYCFRFGTSCENDKSETWYMGYVN